MSHLQQVNEATFASQVLQSSTPVLVDFFATWCGPCRSLAPVLEQLAAEFAGKVKIVKVDVDASPQLAQQYRIQAMPTLVLFENGQEVTRAVGAPPAAQLRQLLASRTTA